MFKSFSFLSLVLVLFFSMALSRGYAQTAPSLDSLMPDNTQFSATMTVACGDLQKSNCAQVLPHIAYYSVPQGVTLNPIASKGSVQSAFGVCKGVVNAAIGQADAFSYVADTTACTASYDTIGAPLYPYFGYLITSAKNSANSLNDLVNNTPDGQSVTIADGKIGSGGQITFGNILATDTEYKQKISEVPEDQNIALGAIQDGSLSGYFIMDSPGSPLIVSIKSATDKNGKPLYKFLDIRPSDQFFALQDWNNKPMYQAVTISSGFFSDKKTVSTNAVIIVNHSYFNSNSQAVNYLRGAADQADAAIRAATLTPSNWTGQISN
jgi:TRAP-type uncharacterized transport system substrate-binding protein